jgi:uncharacterized protein
MNKRIKKFSASSLKALGNYYVYALVDSRYNKIFYIGKGSGQRIFDHENEAHNTSNNSRKCRRIREIENEDHKIKKIIVAWDLTEEEAHKIESSLISLVEYENSKSLTNEQMGHRPQEIATVEEFEHVYGAKKISEKKLAEKVMIVKLNSSYKEGMSEDAIYAISHGNWVADIKKAQQADLVFGVYKTIVVGVYKPESWATCKGGSSNRRIYFNDPNYNSKTQYKKKYLGKSIADFKKIKSQNPVFYTY